MALYENLLAQDSSRIKHLITNLSVDVDPGATTASSHCRGPFAGGSG